MSVSGRPIPTLSWQPRYEAHMTPNTSFQRTLTRAGFGPLNSDR